MATSTEGDAHLDEVLMTLAGKLGGIEPLLKAFFSFLNRKTDFYIEFPDDTKQARFGFPRGIAESLVHKNFKMFPMKDYTKEIARLGEAASELPSSPVPANISKNISRPSKTQSIKKEQVNPNDSHPLLKQGTNEKTSEETNDKRIEGPPIDGPQIRSTESGKQIPIGNGGVTSHYHWTQTLYEVTIYVPVPKNTRASALTCSILPSQLELCFKEGAVVGYGDDVGKLLCGTTPETCRPDESVWIVETDPKGDQSVVVITLEKIKRTWWSNVVKGDPEIDTNMVDSTCKIDEYDPETQGAIRKIMFDQSQKAQGLPSSEQITTDNILEKAKLLPGSPFLQTPNPP